MAINLQIDEALIQEALALGNQQTEHDVIEQALREYVQRRKQLKVLDLFGTIDYDSDYNYKQHLSDKKTAEAQRAQREE